MKKLYLLALPWLLSPALALNVDDINNFTGLACGVQQVADAAGYSSPVDFCSIEKAWKEAIAGVKDAQGLGANLIQMNFNAPLSEVLKQFDTSQLDSQRVTTVLQQTGMTRADLQQAEDKTNQKIREILKKLRDDENYTPEQARQDIGKVLQENSGKVAKFAKSYYDQTLSKLNNLESNYRTAHTNYITTLQQIQQQSKTDGFTSQKVKSLLQQAKQQQQTALNALNQYQSEVAKLKKEIPTLQNILSENMSWSASAKERSRSGEILSAAERNAARLAADKSLQELANKVGEAGQKLVTQAQNATSTRAAVQLLARGFADLGNGLVASQSALQKSLAGLAAQELYTNYQLAQLNERLAAEISQNIAQTSNELSIEYAQIAAKAEDLFKNADRYNAFTGVMGQPSCKKWWKGECN
ncbi:MAG: hypothetical protein N2047_03880 [Meiothermus sp.]|nr:hypothetical protein [Meiothermus sp.]